jgi:hypothetical protein
VALIQKSHDLLNLRASTHLTIYTCIRTKVGRGIVCRINVDEFPHGAQYFVMLWGDPEIGIYFVAHIRLPRMMFKSLDRLRRLRGIRRTTASIEVMTAQGSAI